MKRGNLDDYDPTDGESVDGEDSVEVCPVCRQEFAGVCPIRSAECPFAEEAMEEDEDPDFEDVENLKAVVGDDKEVEKLLEEEEELPPEKPQPKKRAAKRAR